LKIAKDLCGVLSGGAVAFDPNTGQQSMDLGKDPKRPGYLGKDGEAVEYFSVVAEGLIVTNGHAKLWERLCFYRNPSPVRIVGYNGKGIFRSLGYYKRSEYPADAPVGAGGQVAERLGEGNLAPWCVTPPERFGSELAGKKLPYCPEQVRVDSPAYLSETGDEAERWKLRGAANAGVSVFLFFDDMNKRIAQGERSPRTVPYDRCQDFTAVK
jgi:hypothetical protein